MAREGTGSPRRPPKGTKTGARTTRTDGPKAGGTQPKKMRGRPGDRRPPQAARDEAANDARPRRFVSTRVDVEGREEITLVELPDFEPAPWGDDAQLAIVGTPARRADARAKVTGRARYTADLHRPGMLHAAIVRSSIPSGRIRRLDLAPALAIPGVRDAVTAGDVPPFKVRNFHPFEDVVRYVGQPVAVVCAETLELAYRARDAVVVEYEPTPHALTAQAALAPDAPRVRDEGNLAEGEPRVAVRGDVDRGLADAEVVIERTFRTPVALQSALEPHDALAEWNGEQLTVWESTQGIFNTRSDLAGAFGLPLSRVRVMQEFMGGGFGAKNGASTNAYVAVTLARRTGRPVRCVNDREGEQLDSGNRPATVQRVTLGAKRDGTLTAIVLDADIPLGVAGWIGGPGKIYHELYRCPNVRTTQRFVYTNAGAMSSFRAPGHVEGAFGLERAMDVLARELGMDPLELRLKNYAPRDQEKSRSYSSKRLDECYREGAKRFGWGKARKEKGERRKATDGTARGVGMASQVWGGGGGPPAYATVRLNPDGTAEVLTGSQDLGTGSRTIFAQIAAEALGARLEDVHVVIGDTERTPYTGNSWGSITTASVGPAVRMAAEDAKAHLLEAAAELLGSAPHALEVRDSVVRVRKGGKSLTFAEIGHALGDVMIMGRGSRGPNPDDSTLSTFCAQFAEVEVDLETGVVRVVRIVSAHDSGRIINPALAESQIQGGIIQGLGYALFEERVMDEALGIPLNANMHDYKIPTMSDIPVIEVLFVGGADTTANHTGAKGCAEPPIIPTAPAIANAVADAIGAEVNEIPLTPWRVAESERGERRKERV
ncbi:MAG TPA: xanthine dehydrogenase family protein molybdopterin-binding subunit [Gemmatimonadaceae bacterium]|nr:xanthine dehydrogenase family protein molybdopterin-binding subunit [Gemmatimonadaceae bacterium]